MLDLGHLLFSPTMDCYRVQKSWIATLQSFEINGLGLQGSVDIGMDLR